MPDHGSLHPCGILRILMMDVFTLIELLFILPAVFSALVIAKPGFNGIFRGELEGEYAVWVEENIMGETKKWC